MSGSCGNVAISGPISYKQVIFTNLPSIDFEQCKFPNSEIKPRVSFHAPTGTLPSNG